MESFFSAKNNLLAPFKEPDEVISMKKLELGGNEAKMVFFFVFFSVFLFSSLFKDKCFFSSIELMETTLRRGEIGMALTSLVIGFGWL